MNITINEIYKVKVIEEKGLNKIITTGNYDKITMSSDENEMVFEIGRDGIESLVKDLMFEFNKAYPEKLVEILQDPDFKDVTDLLVNDEVEELDTEIRLLKEEVKELKSDLLSERCITSIYEDARD